MKEAAQPTEAEVVSGLIERVTFHNPRNGFCVLKVQARGHRDLQAVVGRAPAVGPGLWITASGRWQDDPSHGLQFEATYIRVTEPESQGGIETYLGSGAIHGIGKVYAKKLVAAFGESVFDVIEHEPQRLRDVPGIGPVRAERIIAAWNDQKAVREIMVFLHAHGVGAARAARIHREYGADAVRVLSENPYLLAKDLRGIGFAGADKIARKMGIAPDAPARIRAGITFVLNEARSDGHCGLPLDELFASAQKLLGVPGELAAAALSDEIAAGAIVDDAVNGRPCAFLSYLHAAERGIAAAFQALLRGQPPWPPIDADRAVPWVERQLGLQLARSQAEAVRQALNSKVTVITGGPGVGKTTIVNAILRILASKDVELALCAPTGRAAKRLSETVGMEAKTIHRLLEFDPSRNGFRRSKGNQLECGLLVVDETSMVDVPLMHALTRALPSEAALLLVGDVDQLPSVGPGQVLGDLIESGAVPVARLVEVFRQAASSRIIVNAHRINKGRLPEMDRPAGESDFYFVPSNDPRTAVRKTVEMVRNRIPRRFGLDPVRDIQVLSPMNQGPTGTKILNRELQAVLNPSPPASLERSGRAYAAGDKVMQVENDYDKEVYNGDIGYIRSIEADGASLRVDFDGREIKYSLRELDTLVPAYATTIHKSQGSEYPAVVILVMNQHFVMLQRNLIYTGITRGKRLVVVVGQRNAVRRAVRTESLSLRWSKLRERMAEVAQQRRALFAMLPGAE